MTIDTTATTEQLQTFTIKRTDERSLRFRGVLLGKNGSSFNNASPDYSGQTGRRETLYLYSTSGGNYVAVREKETQSSKPPTRRSTISDAGAPCSVASKPPTRRST